jgi:hypothetical protein
MQAEATSIHNLAPVRMTVTKKMKDNSVGENMEEKESLLTVVWNLDWYSLMENSVEVLQEVKN